MTSLTSISSQSLQIQPQGPPPHRTPPPPPSSAAAGAGGDRAQANVASLAEALGSDASTLLQKLQSGEDLTTLLRGATGYSSSATVSGGLAVDRYA